MKKIILMCVMVMSACGVDTGEDDGAIGCSPPLQGGESNAVCTPPPPPPPETIPAWQACVEQAIAYCGGYTAETQDCVFAYNAGCHPPKSTVLVSQQNQCLAEMPDLTRTCALIRGQ